MDWVIGDVHGHIRPLEKILNQIESKDKDAHIYLAGDYCDRGPDTKAVVDRILAADNIKCVCGNHDDVFNCILSGKPTGNGEYTGSEAPLEALSWFMNFGMIDTFRSYGVYLDEIKAASKSKYALASLVKEKVPPEHHKFFAELPLIIDVGDFFVCHAMVPTNIAIATLLSPPPISHDNLQQAIVISRCTRDMLWGRFSDMDLICEKAWGKTGYFGHTPTPTRFKSDAPVFGKDMVLVDTGCFIGNALSAVCHQTKEIIMMPPQLD